MRSEYPPEQVKEEKTNLDATCVKASHRTGTENESAVEWQKLQYYGVIGAARSRSCNARVKIKQIIM